MVKIINLLKIQFILNLGIWMPTYFKGNSHFYLEGFKGGIQIP